MRSEKEEISADLFIPRLTDQLGTKSFDEVPQQARCRGSETFYDVFDGQHKASRMRSSTEIPECAEIEDLGKSRSCTTAGAPPHVRSQMKGCHACVRLVLRDGRVADRVYSRTSRNSSTIASF